VAKSDFLLRNALMSANYKAVVNKPDSFLVHERLSHSSADMFLLFGENQSASAENNVLNLNCE
jgi:hypothetical protein